MRQTSQQSGRPGNVFPAEVNKEKNTESSSTEQKVSDSTVENVNESFEVSRHRRRWYHSICRPQTLLQFLLEDWLFLAVLGILTACFSLLMDTCTDKLQTYHVKSMDLVRKTGEDEKDIILRFVVWLAYTVVALMTGAVFTHYVAPQAIGSGIPEMKTILRGVALKEYLSLRTLISKLVGLTLAIGSGFPIGKEGPFVHVGSMLANLISRVVRSFKPVYSNESRSGELLAAGCAAGVACTFSAPIGGVLFSIEVTAVYFAVRDYWRGFFAACCGSAVFSLLRIYTHSSQVTVSAFVQTTFDNRTFYPEELFFFALIGLFCGFAGAVFILIHRRVVLFLRRNNVMKFLFQRNWLVYPLVISALYAGLTYPRGLGKHLTGDTVYGHTLRDFFTNCTWHAESWMVTSCKGDLTSRWSEDGSVFIQLPIFIVSFYFLNIISSTLPVPAGIFMPVFVLGAAIGRFFGEVMAYNFPNGMRGDQNMLVYPGVYAVVGAASFCGAVTHTVSVAVIAFELTGQLVHSLPVTIAVIIANIVCSSFQPSFFDSIIKIKHLPYLPDIPKSTSEVHSIRVEQIMIRNVKSLSKKSTYRELQDLLINMPRLKAFPVVDDPSSKVLLGSVNRNVLLRMLEEKVGEEARLAEAFKRAQIELQVIGVGDAIEEITRFTVVPVYLKDRRGSALMGDDNEVGRTHRFKNENKDSLLQKRLVNGKNNLSVTRTLTNGLLGTSLKADNTKNDMTSGPKRSRLLSSHSAQEVYSTIGDMLRSITNSFHPGRIPKKQKKEGDLDEEERREWELKQLSCRLEFDPETIDPAPFQLVKSTSLYKVHSLFSLLGIRRAYVTNCGVLIGVVALREVRTAIERAHSGDLTASTQFTIPSSSSGSDDADSIKKKDIEACRSTSGETDSETDDDDCILPRVEVEEKSTPVGRPCVYSHLASANFSYADSTDDDESGNEERRPSSSSTNRKPTLIGLVPEGLDRYLSEYSKDPTRHIQVVHAPPSETGASAPPCSPKGGNRHVYIVEPNEQSSMEKDGGNEPSTSKKSLLENLPKYLGIMPTLLKGNRGSSAGSPSSDGESKVFFVKSDGEVISVAEEVENMRRTSDFSWPQSNFTRSRSERIVKDSFRRWAKRRWSLQPFKGHKNIVDSTLQNKRESQPSTSKTTELDRPVVKKNKSTSGYPKLSSSLTDILSIIPEPVVNRRGGRK